MLVPCCVHPVLSACASFCCVRPFLVSVPILHRAACVQATSAWYITLIMCQAWHIWVTKTRRVSMFKHAGVITNRTTYYGVFISLVVMVICVYVPYLQDHVFFTANPPTCRPGYPTSVSWCSLLPIRNGRRHWLAQTPTTGSSDGSCGKKVGYEVSVHLQLQPSPTAGVSQVIFVLAIACGSYTNAMHVGKLYHGSSGHALIARCMCATRGIGVYFNLVKC